MLHRVAQPRAHKSRSAVVLEGLANLVGVEDVTFLKE
jgi:hypothetical protein